MSLVSQDTEAVNRIIIIDEMNNSSHRPSTR